MPNSHSPSSMISDLSQLVPRLWPFLYHSSSVVRGSALKTLHTLTACAGSTSTTNHPPTATTTTTVPQFSPQRATTVFTTSYSDTTTSSGINASTTIVSKESQFLTTIASVDCDTTHTTSTVKPSTTNAQIADCDKTANSQCVASAVTTAGESIMHEKDHELYMQKEHKNKEHFETQQGSGGGGLEMLKKEENVCQKESLVVKQDSEIKNEDNDVPSSVKSENVELDEEKCCRKIVGSSVKVEYSWLSPIIQQLLTHIYQRALLEESDENLKLVFQVSRKCFGSYM